MSDLPPLITRSEVQAYQRVVRSAVLITLFGSGLTLLVLLLSGVPWSGRYAAVLAFAAMALVGQELLHRSVRAGTAVVIIGFWIAASWNTVSYAGVHSANLLIYAFLVAMSGWIMGRRWLVVVTSMTVLLVVGLGATEIAGWYQPTARAPVVVVAATLIGALVALAFLTEIAYSTFRSERDRALELSQRVARREADLRMIMSHVPAALASFDASSRLRFGNQRYAAMFGASPEALVGRHISEYVPADTLAGLMPDWTRALAGHNSQYRRMNRDPESGETRVIDVELVPEFEQGQVIGLFALVIDVTDKVADELRIRELNDNLERRVRERSLELEDATGRLQRLQEELARSEAKATLNTMVASITHELSSPLSVSLVAADAMLERSAAFQRRMAEQPLRRSELNEFVDATSDGSRMAARNLQRAFEILKTFRQVANNQAHEQQCEFDLAQSLHEVLDMLAPMLRRQPHRVVLDLPDGIVLDSRPGPLSQVAINLINNALLHAFEAGKPGTLRISAEALGDRVQLRFQDNGRGMSADQQMRLFEPFFTTKAGQGGTGLGLTIVEHLVRKSLGGTIRVRSAPGEGSCFELDLPRTAPPQQPPSVLLPG